MKKTVTQTPRRWGFRISATDVLVLLLAAGLTCLLRVKEFPLWWVALMVTGHFFLFCNVFLVWQRLELVWSAVFVLNVSAHVSAAHFDLVSPILIQIPATVLVIWWQIRSPWYHGILADRINPRLQDYLANNL